MEASSPLAALRPAPPVFGDRLFGSRNTHLAPSAFRAGSLNLRDQFNFHQRSNVDYFNVGAVRGSSPAASLAADLSVNFKLNDARLVSLVPKTICGVC